MANNTTKGLWALSPLAVFLCLYLVTSLVAGDFYKVPIAVAFLGGIGLCRADYPGHEAVRAGGTVLGWCGA